MDFNACKFEDPGQYDQIRCWGGAQSLLTMLPGVHVVSLPAITQISGTGLFITLRKDEAMRVETFAFFCFFWKDLKLTHSR